MTTAIDPIDSLTSEEIAEIEALPENRRERAAVQLENMRSALRRNEARDQEADAGPGAESNSVHKFIQLAEDRYKLDIPEIQASFDVGYLRRERGELVGELAVECRLPCVRVYNGTVSIASFNLSGARSRTDRARFLASRVDGVEIDWTAYLEELCQRVLAAERQGQPATDLRTFPLPQADDSLRVDRLFFPRRHPV